jgi:hypothetical protein
MVSSNSRQVGVTQSGEQRCSNEEQKRCADDETQARDALQKEWTQFTSSAKKQCYEEANIDSTPSYVELLTCLEMERDVKTEQGGKMSK